MTSPAPRPGHPVYAAASDAAASGSLPYGLGFIAYLPIPFVNLLITGVVMAAVYPGQRRRSHLAAENARRAANWGLTVIAAMVVMAVLPRAGHRPPRRHHQRARQGQTGHRLRESDRDPLPALTGAARRVADAPATGQGAPPSAISLR